MTRVTYKIVQHDGGWAYTVNGVFSEAFATHAAALAAAKLFNSDCAADTAVRRPNSPLVVAGRALTEDRPPASLAALVRGDRVAAKRAFVPAYAPLRNPLRKVSLKRDECAERHGDPDN